MAPMPCGGRFEMDPHHGPEWGVRLRYRLGAFATCEFVPVEDWHSDERVLLNVARARAALCVRAAVHAARQP